MTDVQLRISTPPSPESWWQPGSYSRKAMAVATTVSLWVAGQALGLGPEGSPGMAVNRSSPEPDKAWAKAGTAEPEHTPAELFFARRDRETSVFFERPGTYEFEPSPIRNSDGSLDVWYCGGELGGPHFNHDENYLVRFDALGGQQGPSQSVVQPSFLHGVADGRNACHPSVIRHGFPGVTYPGGVLGPGDELYYMYYECGARAIDNLTGTEARPPVQICLAASTDGETWMKYRDDLFGSQGTHFGSASTLPTPVIEMNPQVRSGCNFEERDGVYYVDWDIDPSTDIIEGGCGRVDLYYGSGHPTAVTVPVGDRRQVWLFYYDSGGATNEKGMRLARSDDGFHFYPVEDLYAVDENGAQLYHADGKPVRLERGIVKYYPGEFAGHQGVFLAMAAAFGSQYFAYSFDGTSWVVPWPTFRANQDLRLAGVHADDQDADRNLCPAPGPPSPVSDAYGYIDRLTHVEILVSEGLREKMRYDDEPFPLLPADIGSPAVTVPHPCPLPMGASGGFEATTWDLYRLWGDFGHDSSESSLIGHEYCSLYEGQNVRQTAKRTDPAGTSIDGRTYRVEDGAFRRYTDEAHFLALNDNDPHAYLAVSADTLDRIEIECLDGGTLDPPPMEPCAGFDRVNVRKGFAPNEGSIVWIEDGQRYSYAGGWSKPAGHELYRWTFLFLNYQDPTAFVDSGGSAAWDALIASCPYGGPRQPTVCHDFDDLEVSPSNSSLVQFVRWGNRYGYNGWCGCGPQPCECQLHSFVEVNGTGTPNISEVTPEVFTELEQTCPYVGLKGELDP